MRLLIGEIVYLGKKIVYWRNLVSHYVQGKRPWRLGYFEYKWKHIKKTLSDIKIMSYFKNRDSLPNNFGKRIDERIVEYPWALANIEERPGTLLDAGSALNFETILLHEKIKNKKITIVTLAPETNSFPEINYVFEDMRKMSFPENTFDTITSISTIEHVGMDNTEIYTDDAKYKESKSDDYIKAIEELKRVLKPGGVALITVPFGKYNNFGFFQQFNKSMLEKIINAFKPNWYEITFYKYNNGWQISDIDSASSAEYTLAKKAKESKVLPVAAEAVACIKLIK